MLRAFTLSACRTLRMDITALCDLGVRVLVDVTAACPSTATALNHGSNTRPGATAEALERTKYRKYPGVPVTAAALETGGRPGEGLTLLVRRMGRGMTPSDGAIFLSGAWRSFSVAFQSGDAAALLAAAALA